MAVAGVVEKKEETKHHRSRSSGKSKLKVGFPKANRCPFLETEKLRDQDERTRAFRFTGEKGYRTAISGHGVKYGHYYFEVEAEESLLPPFINVQPAIRVGFTCL